MQLVLKIKKGALFNVQRKHESRFRNTLNRKKKNDIDVRGNLNLDTGVKGRCTAELKGGGERPFARLITEIGLVELRFMAGRLGDVVSLAQGTQAEGLEV